MEVFYEPGTRDPGELLEFARELLSEVRDGGGALEEAREVGVDVAELLNESRIGQEISVEPDRSGFDPISTVIIVTIARPVVLDLWRKVLLPRIVRRWGATAIGPEVEPREPPATK
jgi:hypothetical protein